MKHYETSFNADNGIGARAQVYHPGECHYTPGFVSFHIAERGGVFGPLVIRMPYAYADKAKRIAAFINEVMAEDDSADKPLVEAIPDAAE